MSEAEAMDVEVDPLTNSTTDSDSGKLFIYFMTKESCTFWLPNLNLGTITVRELMKSIHNHPQFPKDFVESVDHLDLLHNGTLITEHTESTLQSLKIRSTAPIAVVKNLNKSKAKVAEKKKFTSDEIRQTSMALRTSFLNPSFLKIVQKLRDPETMENIFTIAPGLRSDPVGSTLIQSPQMLFLLSEPEALTTLAETRPWVVEAFNYIAATIHQEKGSSGNSRQFSIAQLMNPALGDDEDMDEDDSEADNPAGPSGSGANRTPNNIRGGITRDQLSRALNIAQSLGSGLGQSQLGQNSLSSLFGASPTRPSTAPPATTPSSNATTNQGSPNSAPISGDMVARMLSSALSQLPSGQREQQFDALRQLAQQISNSPQPTSGATIPSGGETVENQEYPAQLAQMRELGITDERLSILALRVSGGDVETAAELIFSGWDGSGAEPDS